MSDKMSLRNAIACLCEASDELLTDGGAGREQGQDIDRAQATLRRMIDPELSFLDMTLEECGAWLQHFSHEFKAAGRKLYDKDTQFDIGMRASCMLTLCRDAFDMNAAELKWTMTDVTFGDKPAGDWRVTLEQLGEDGEPIPSDGEQIVTSGPMPSRSVEVPDDV